MTQNFKHYLKHAALGVFVMTQLLSFSTAHAQQDYGDWNIKDFNAVIQVNKDSTINVTEKLEVDFTRETHHGIFRYIPIKYTDDKGYESQIPIHVLSVLQDGTPATYDVTNEGDNINIKIGDANVELDSVVDYTIKYQAERALTNYSDHDELYWNATGNGWAIPIDKAEATIILPQTVDKSQLKATCYTGLEGSKDQNCTATVGEGNSNVTNSKTFQFSAFAPGRAAGQSALQGGEGMTIVAWYPKGMIDPSPPSPEQLFAAAPWYEKIYLFMTHNWGLFIPMAVLALMTFLWYTRGRDPRTGRTAIMPIYTPPDNLRPTEIGTIVDESVDIQDITSTIIDMAVRGYLQIIENKSKAMFFNITTYKFKLLKPDYASDKDLLDYEQQLLTSIFGGGTERDLTDLQNQFYKDIPGIKKSVYDRLIANGYFPSNPETIRKLYLGFGSALLFGMFFFLGALINFAPWSLVVGIGASGAIIIIFSRFMSVKTLKGVEMRYQILGLEEFIKTAEADRLKFQEKENIFEKLLPYAMALGIADKWTKAFDGIYKTPPSWYQSNDPMFMSHFSTYYFLSSINGLNTNMSSTFQSSPRSSGSGFGGGGFSGGGGGGGGGGAW